MKKAVTVILGMAIATGLGSCNPISPSPQATDEGLPATATSPALPSDTPSLDGPSLFTPAPSTPYPSPTVPITLANVGEMVPLARVPGSELRSVTFSLDGRLVAVSVPPRVLLYGVGALHEVDSFSIPEGIALAISPDGSLLAYGLSDGTIQTWDIALGVEGHLRARHPNQVLDLEFSPDGSILASASGDGTIRLWNPAGGGIFQELSGHGSDNVVFDVAFSPDGSQLASVGGDGTVRFWDVASGEELRTLRGHETYVSSLSFSPDGSLLATGWGDGAVIVFDVASGTEILELLGHRRGVNQVAFSPDGSLLASVAGDVILWDSASGARARILSDPASWTLSFSPDGRLMALTSWNGDVWLWGIAP